MTFGFDDFDTVDKSGRTESTNGADGIRGSKLIIITNSMLKTVALLLENFEIFIGDNTAGDWTDEFVE